MEHYFRQYFKIFMNKAERLKIILALLKVIKKNYMGFLQNSQGISFSELINHHNRKNLHM